MRGGDAAICQITLTTCYVIFIHAPDRQMNRSGINMQVQRQKCSWLRLFRPSN